MMPDSDHRECPFCAEIIKKKAILCRYCKSELAPGEGRSLKKASSVKKNSDSKISATSNGKKRPAKRMACKKCGKTVGYLTIKKGICGDCRRKQSPNSVVIPVKVEQNPAKKIFCPHCQEKGYVSVRKERKKTGISTTKASFAVVTLGLTTLVTGLAKIDIITIAHCRNCDQEWEM